MFAKLYLRLADCQHRAFLGRHSTLERGFTASHQEYSRCTKCHMVWPQPLQLSIHEWKRGRLRDNVATDEEPALNALPP
jgi:hypothetical protein